MGPDRFEEKHGRKILVAEPRYPSVEAYMNAQEQPHRDTLQAIVAVITHHFPELELTLAWNVPHFKLGKEYVAGLSTLKSYVAFSPWSEMVMNSHRESFGELESTKNLIRIPLGWEPDEHLLVTLVKARLSELI